jgi:23S rRNA-/tRNA-specific pseudouridylate synthase
MFKAAERLLVRWFSKATKYNSKLVDSNHVGLRLDQYLKAHGVKWSSLQRSLRNRYYYVRGQDDVMVRDAGYRLKQEDEVFYPHNSELHQYFEFQATNGDEANFFKLPREQAMSEIKSMTIFENDHLIVLNKKAGYATQGGQDYERNLFTLLISCYDRSAVHIMHRLDLPCSGVVMFAKSS